MGDLIRVSFKGQSIGVGFSRKEGTPDSWVILLHGLQSCREAFSSFFNSPELQERSLLAIDFMGFGESEKPQSFDYSLEAQADIVLALLSQLGVEKFSVVGHSLGGMVATLLLEKAPQRIDSLVSLEGNLTFADCGESAEIIKMSESEFSESFPAWLNKIKSSGDSTGSLRYAWIHRLPSYVIYRTARSIVDWSKSKHLLEIFQISPHRKLLLRGSRSNYCSNPTLSSLKVKTIEGGHFMFLEQPEATMQLISDFLRNN